MTSSAAVCTGGMQPVIDYPTQLRAAETSLGEAEARYNALTELSSEWYWEHDAEQRFTRISERVQDRTGIAPNAILGKTRWETDIGYDPAERAALEAVMAARRPFYDFQFTRASLGGGLRHISVSGEPMVDRNGVYHGYRGIGKDITERKRGQSALEESQRFSRATLDALSDHMCVLDASGTIVTVNRSWCRFLDANRGGVTGDFIGAGYLAACDNASGDGREDGLAAAAGIRAVMSGELAQFRQEYRCDGPDESRWFAMKATRFPGAGAVRVVIAHEDITERKAAEARVERINTLFQALGETNDAIIRIRDRTELMHVVTKITATLGRFLAGKVWMKETNSTFVNAALTKGKAGENLGGTLERFNLASWVSDGPTGQALTDDRTVVRNDIDRLRSPRGQWTGALESVRSSAAFPLREDGRVIGALTIYSAEVGYFNPALVELLERIAAGLSLGLANLGRDAKRKASESALLVSEARFRNLTELSSDWYWEQNETLRFTSLCNGTEIKAGLAPDADLGKARWELSGVGDADWQGHRDTLAARKAFRDFEFKRTFPDGSVRDTCISGEPIFDVDGGFAGYRGVGRDVTEARREARILALEHRVARCLTEGGETQAAIETVIRAICEIEGWSCGIHMTADEEAGVLRTSHSWSVPGGKVRQFIEKVRDLQMPRTGGVCGEVWQSGKPIWIADVRDDARTWRQDMIIEGGVRGAFGFPCTQAGKTVGVFMLFSDEIRKPNERLLSAVSLIGSQAGEFLQHRRAEEQLRFQALLLGTVGEAVVATDIAGRITYWNDYAERLFGWTAAEVLGADVLEITRATEGTSDGWEAMRQGSLAHVWRGETLAKRRNGETFPAQLTLAPVFDAGGVLTGLIGVSRDISELKRAEKVIRDNARQQGVIAAFGQHALASADLDDLLEQAAVAVGEGLDVGFSAVLQLAPDGHSVLARAGLGWHDGWLKRHTADVGPGSRNRFVLDSGETVVVDDFQTENRFAIDGFVALHELRSSVAVAIGGAAGTFGVLSAYSRDVGRFESGGVNFLRSVASTLATAIDRRAAEDRVTYLAQFDSLTGLPNRNLLRDRLASAMAQAGRHKWGVGVMFIDLDGFKEVNDTFGHAVGDRLLVEVARRLKDCIREGDTVGRLGGDEFAIVLANMATTDRANTVARRVLEALTGPIDVQGQDVRVTASLGISVHPGDGDTPELMLKNADTAMYRAKEQGRNNWQFFTEELNARNARRMDLERELRQAVERNEFRLHYQPEVSLDHGRIVGVEALIRWQHPTRGLLAPAEFLAVAEETELILPIGRWVVDTACAQAAEWHRGGHRGLSVAVNMSPAEIRRGNVTEQVRASLARSGMDPRCLEIEITESLGIDGAEPLIRTLDALKDLGVSVAIDDFGTGYSTLGYLKRFPIDKVKIDRMFIRDIVRDADDAAIVQAIIAMSHHLTLKVTAKGVETEEQAGFLRRHHCDSAQGYLFGMPMEAAQLGALLAERNGRPLWSVPEGSCRSLLLVDDDADVLELLQAVLRAEGYDIHLATSGQQALDIMATTTIAVVVSDYRMPGMNGIEFLRRAKTMHPNTMRMVLSGHADPATVTMAIHDGAVYKFLTKPSTNTDLRDEVRRAFHHYEQEAARRLSAAGFTSSDRAAA